MTKKTFTSGLDSLVGDYKKQKGRPTTSTRVVSKSSQEGTKENETRATFIVKEDLLEKLKGVAYWERIMIKDVINTALGEYLKKYEKANGDIKPAPIK